MKILNDVSFFIYQIGKELKKRDHTQSWRFVGKEAISYSHGGDINWCSLFGGEFDNIKILNARVL